MSKSKSGGGNRGRRKPNINLIATSRCYSVREAAERLDRTVYTLRNWITQGLPVLPDVNPSLIDGAILKAWLKAKWAKRKKPCGIGELFCCKCGEPRAPDPASVKTGSGLSPTTANVSGKCATCGTHMQQARKMSDLPEILAAMRGQAKADSNLIGYRHPCAKPTHWQGQGVLNFEQHEGGSDSVH
jgi:hypothetical protein